jgi:hypothetical protein
MLFFFRTCLKNAVFFFFRKERSFAIVGERQEEVSRWNSSTRSSRPQLEITMKARMSQFNWKIQERPINSNVVGTGLKLRTLLLKVQQPPPWPTPL